ncbi:MAG: hypothetical protein K2J17_07330 [Paramuribaculum sp.]|nr:hypothetical protein [Paramuribaculum sp.]
MVVWLVCRALTNRDNKKTQIVIKAIESNSPIDVYKLAEALSNKEKSAEQVLHLWLLRGCTFTFVGVALAIFALVMALRMYDTDVELFFLFLSVISFAIGLAYLVVYFVTRKSINKNS